MKLVWETAFAIILGTYDILAKVRLRSGLSKQQPDRYEELNW